jgi:acetamidase/formamidase
VTLHEIPLERRTLHGHFSRDLEPILSVEPGDAIAFATLNAGWHMTDDKRFDPWDAELDAGHALIGPVEVRGARAGQALVVRIDEVRPGSWGVTFGHETKVLWQYDGSAAEWVDDQGRRVTAAPFLGVLGMPPAEPGRHSTAPPRSSGGNIDCKELLPGSTLYLPIPFDGAWFSAGDGHGAQADGEASGTAIECPLDRAQLTLDVVELELGSPIARVPGAWIAFGFDEDLDLAAEQAMATTLDLMERELRIERSYALALASIVVDLRVTQIVNGAKGVHAVLRDDAIR